MVRTRSTWRGMTACLAVLVAFAAVRPAPAADKEIASALDQVPADAAIVVLAPNARGLSDKIARFSRQMGISAPQMQDVLTMLENQMGLVNGLRENGSVLIVLPDISALRGAVDPQGPHMDEPPAVIVLAPVADHDQFLTNFQNVRSDQGLQHGLAAMGKEFYIKNLGAHAALSNNAAALAKYEPARQAQATLTAVGKLARGYLADCDLAIVLNVKVMEPTLTPLIREGMKMAAQQMDHAQQMGMGPDPASAAMAKVFFGLYSDAGLALVRDTDLAVISMDLTDKGLGLSAAAKFRLDTPLAKAFAGAQPARGELAKLLDQPYLMATAVNLQGIDVAGLLGALEKRLGSAHAGPFAAMMKAGFPMYRHVQSMGQAVYISAQPGIGGSMLASVTVMQAEDPATLIAAQRQAIEAMGQFSMPVPAPGQAMDNAPAPGEAGAGNTLNFVTSYTPQALKVGELSVDQYTWQMNLPQEAMAGNPIMPVLAMLGATAHTGYIAQSGRHVIVTSTPDPTLLSSTAAALAANGEGARLADNKALGSVRQAGLVPDAAMEYYLNPGSLAGLISTFAVMFGGPQVQAPADLPPLAMSAGVQESTLAVRTYVPTAVMTWVRDTIQQFQAPAVGQPGQPGQRRRPGAPPVAPN